MSPEAFEALKVIIHEAMLEYPHAEPHPETVEAIAQGLVAVIDLSNSRPAKYAVEPWLDQSVQYHCEHAADHAENARAALTETFDWFSDLGQPEIAHACLRSMFALYAFNAGKRRF